MLGAFLGASSTGARGQLPVDAAVKHSDAGKSATRLADVVYVNAQDLALLQAYQVPADVKREKRAKQAMTTAFAAIEKISKDAQEKAMAGLIPKSVARFIADETEAARAVIRAQESVRDIRAEALKDSWDGKGRYAQLMLKLYGQLPGPVNTPDFFLGLLTWARYGFPPVLMEAKIDPALTPVEAYFIKLKQVVDSPNPNTLSKVPKLGEADLANKNFLNNHNVLKASAVKAGN